MSDRTMTLEEAAAYCKLSPHTLKKYRVYGWIVPTVKAKGKLRLYTREDLERWLAAPRAYGRPGKPEVAA
jgi:DNA-binding transcriptional MerR regulator